MFKAVPKKGQFAIAWTVNGQIWSRTFKWEDDLLKVWRRGQWKHVVNPPAYFSQYQGSNMVSLVADSRNVPNFYSPEVNA